MINSKFYSVVIVLNYAHVLRDDGVGYGDYVEQITYLIFLKMADERERAGQAGGVPSAFGWTKPAKLDWDELEVQYRHTLEELGKSPRHWALRKSDIAFKFV